MTVEDRTVLEELIAAGDISPDALREIQTPFDVAVRDHGLTHALLTMLRLSEETIAQAICRAMKLARMTVASEAETAPGNLFTDDEIQRLKILPVFHIGLELTVAFINPPARALRIQLQRLTGYRVLPVITTVSDFEAAFRRYKGALDTLQRVASLIPLEAFDLKTPERISARQAGRGQIDPTMAEFAEELLLRGAKLGASDIHIEPTETELLVRFRLDGVLHRIVSLPLSYHAGLVSVLKGKSGMDIFERNIPQDGRFSLNFADRVFDVRASSLPLVYGEKLVLRLLSKTSVLINLQNLGFSEKNLLMIRSLLQLPNGIILVTGPTGSGKSTTLYAALNEIKSMNRNIVTVENPVEYKLPLISQVQVASERGMTFASALRAILRQDPNIILVGEIRDSETGIIATEAALTGHLVLSTLHTNDAIGAIPRLINIGVASFWISASVIGVVAQRLVRKICHRCREEYRPPREYLATLGLSHLPPEITLFRGTGCGACDSTGYKGRIAIHEILVITEDMRDAIYGDVTTGKLRTLAAATGFRDMYFDGITKALAGITTLAEIQRVTRRAV